MLLYRPASYLPCVLGGEGVFQVVSTGLSSPAPPTATAACLGTCRLQLVGKNAFQITASVNSACTARPQTLLYSQPTPPPPLSQFNSRGKGCGSWLGGCYSSPVYPRTSLLSGSGRDQLFSISQAVRGSILNSKIGQS